ncbi:Crp/Fnr family transcriptional regulator [Tardiphaga sp. 841_E9_N1_2]|jgi:CRP/FNR family cyclic AMP-dependent transcriptional regulator|uniref:Crp/Fnr family transcriptional regulator n=1 Tax=Tardiphaga sp. 841_E9_N1_2 TaxID=3240762 RepID=UPI003F262667
MTSLKALSDSREAYLPATAVTLRGGHACRTSPSSAGVASGRSITTAPAVRQSDLSALFMSETIDDLNDGAYFLDRLTVEERAQIRESGRQFTVRQGEAIFSQGAHHQGIFIIERGQVRVFYTAPTGREITLAYWTPGHFIGGPSISGGGTHMWSGVAIEDCDITHLSSATLQALLLRMPTFALALIDGLVAKGKCYSSMAQMLGTRSVIERLAQYILNLSELYGVADGDAIVINRKVTHDQIAAMVGSTRQWVTMMLKRFHAKRIVSIDGGVIRIHRLDQLEQILLKD